MAYSEPLAKRVREALGKRKDVTEKNLKYWLDLALDFNKRAKASKKRT